MQHDLLQICRRKRKAIGQRSVLLVQERFQFALVAARADESGAQRRAARGILAL